MDVSIWKLADDRRAYGECAGWYILVTPDGEDEVMSLPLEHEHEVRAYAHAQGWSIVPLNEEV